MSFNEIECHVNTSLGLLGEDASLHPPLCPRLTALLNFVYVYVNTQYIFFIKLNASSVSEMINA